MSSVATAECPVEPAPATGNQEIQELVTQVDPILQKAPTAPCNLQLSQEQITQQALALQQEALRLEQTEKDEATRQKHLEEWIGKNLDASIAGLMAAKLDLAQQLADYDRMVSDKQALETDPGLRASYEEYLRRQKTVTSLATIAALGRLPRPNDTAEMRRDREEALKLLRSPEVGLMHDQLRTVYQPSGPVTAYPMLRQERVPVFKNSNSAEVRSDDLIEANFQLVEASKKFLHSAKEKLSAQALERFREQDKTITREAITLGADLTEKEYHTFNRKLAAGYLAFETATWLVPVGRIGKVVGTKLGTTLVTEGAHSISALQALKTIWNSGKAIKTLSTTDKLRHMARFSAAGFTGGAIFGGRFAVAGKAIDSFGREEDFLCALANRYSRDGNSAKAAVSIGLLGAGIAGTAGLLPRIGLLIRGGFIIDGSAQTFQTLAAAQKLYAQGDTPGAIRELHRAGLVGYGTFTTLQSALTVRNSHIGEKPDAAQD